MLLLIKPEGASIRLEGGEASNVYVEATTGVLVAESAPGSGTFEFAVPANGQAHATGIVVTKNMDIAAVAASMGLNSAHSKQVCPRQKPSMTTHFS